MKLINDGMKPIYIQISEWLETEILCGSIQRDEKIYSQYQLAQMFNINPATAAKGLNILADEGILYKKRGLGMYVSSSAQEMIKDKRKSQILSTRLLELVIEADRLGIKEDELIMMIRKAKNDYQGG